ncbi:alpha/beta fold hydrolase [Derxia lacustris]|uniref:alpha/beta fold hydrolase n=1 Tax=Derxia lacustris TaxID=764842 RepID=UPI001594E34A|nr:alpha/beta fold hydrolase [Derxia lacustris]
MHDSLLPHTFSALSMTAHSFHRLAASRWACAEPQARLICAHGLTRNRHDFEPLARALQAEIEVLSFDFSGRGDSDRLAAPSDYGFAQYEMDALAVLSAIEHRAAAWPTAQRSHGPEPQARVRHHKPNWWQRLLGFRPPLVLGGEEAPEPARHPRGRLPTVWLGTSMGGLVGLMLAARANTPIDALVLNDVGPMVPWTGISRLASYVGRHTRFDTQEEVEAHLRDVCRDFGPLTDEQWATLAATSAEADGKGGHALRYDPAIARGLALGGGLFGRTGLRWWEGVDLWHLWEQVHCPVLVLRGAESDILPEAVAREMQRRKPQTRVVEFAGVGHAPALVDAAQIAEVRRFVLEQAARAPARAEPPLGQLRPLSA